MAFVEFYTENCFMFELLDFVIFKRRITHALNSRCGIRGCEELECMLVTSIYTYT